MLRMVSSNNRYHPISFLWLSDRVGGFHLVPLLFTATILACLFSDYLYLFCPTKNSAGALPT